MLMSVAAVTEALEEPHQTRRVLKGSPAGGGNRKRWDVTVSCLPFRADELVSDLRRSWSSSRGRREANAS